jgi:DNA-binding NarL/FixJ family response regulator
MAVRIGLRALLEAGGPAGEDNQPAGPQVKIVAEAASLESLEPLPWDTDVVVVTDDTAGEAELRRVLEELASPPGVLLLSSEAGARNLSDLPVRAWGVLDLDSSPEELSAAIYAVANGLWVGAPRLIETWLPETPDPDPSMQPLTEREMEVLQLLAQGLANKQIAHQLGISEHTVKFHVSAIYGKLGATNRTEAVRLGIQQGWVVI